MATNKQYRNSAAIRLGQKNEDNAQSIGYRGYVVGDLKKEGDISYQIKWRPEGLAKVYGKVIQPFKQPFDVPPCNKAELRTVVTNYLNDNYRRGAYKATETDEPEPVVIVSQIVALGDEPAHVKIFRYTLEDEKISTVVSTKVTEV